MDKISHKKGKEVFLENKAKHIEFREFYSPGQIKKILAVNGALMMLAAIITVIGLVTGYTFESTYVKEFYWLAIGSGATFLPSMLVYCIPSPTLRRRRPAMFEFIILMDAMIYLCWGFYVLHNSVEGDGPNNYLVLLMEYAVISIFFYYSIHHYFALYIFCCVGAWHITKYAPPGSFNNNIVFCVVLFGLILTLAGVSNYYFSSKEYFADKEKEAFKADLELSNRDLKSANENLIDVTRRLKNNLEAQRLFTAGMSHELRSPLNGIIGLLQILKNDKTINEEAQENVDKALTSSVTLIRIVNDLLDFYKLEAGELKIIKAPFNLKEINENVMNVCKESAESKGLSLEVIALPDMPASFMGDGVRIQQIITNIATNGIKYTESGYVRIGYSYEAGYLTISVEDSGQGISEKAQESLFDPFTRFNENQNRYIQGTGLGLYIVKSLVEQMEGGITLKSKEGRGSNFTVRLPLEIHDKNAKFGDELIKIQEEETIPDFTGCNILCVDDNRVNLSVFKGLFKGTNANLKLLLGGKECLEEIKRQKYDLIFLDHLMPEMDGIETFQNMKKGGHLNEDTPVVMLTANAGAEAELRYKEEGFDGYLSKPVLRKDLHELARKLIKL